MNKGILQQINSSKPLFYKPFTKKLFDEVFNKINKIKQNSIKPIFYTSELGYINLDCTSILYFNPKDIKSNIIVKLFKKHNFYRRMIELNKIKKHHIEVCYSLISLEEFNKRLNKWINLEKDIENQIKEIYYNE